MITAQTTTTTDRFFLPQTKPQTKRRRRDTSLRRRPLHRHKEIRQAIKAAKGLRTKFSALARHFDSLIRSLQAAIITDIIIAIEGGGCWRVTDFMDYCRVSRSVVDRILRELEAQGAIKKSKNKCAGKGRPFYTFRATPLAVERPDLIQNAKK